MHMLYFLHVADGMMLGCFYNKFENQYAILVLQTSWASSYALNLH